MRLPKSCRDQAWTISDELLQHVTTLSGALADPQSRGNSRAIVAKNHDQNHAMYMAFHGCSSAHN